MKIRWWIAILLVIGLIAGPAIKGIPGFVVIAYQQTTIQFPLWLAVASAILLVLIVAVLFSLISRFVTATNKAKNWKGSRKWKQARKETISAMISFAEGNWADAEKKMIKASANGDTKLINYLVAAQAAQKQDAFSKRDDYLKRAKTVSPNADVAIGITQARLQMESAQNEEALATLTHLSELAPKNKYINQLFVDVNIKLESWNVVWSKIKQLEKQKTYTREKILEIKRQAICGIMLSKVKNNQLQELSVFWDGLSNKLKKDPVLALEYSKILISVNNHAKAEELLKKLLKLEPTTEAVKLYAKLKTNKPGKQLDFMESLSHHNIVESEYFAALAELANTAELWGKSRDYLKRSLDIEDSVKTRAHLANTLVRLGEDKEAQNEREKAVKLLETDIAPK